MPIYEVQLSPGAIISKGPCIPIEMSLPKTLLSQLQEQGQTIPESVKGNVLVDTGASISAIDNSVVQKLNLNPIGVTTIGTAGDPIETNEYTVRFVFPHFRIDIGKVIALNLTRFKIEAIIGRDLLSRFLLIYHGPASRFTLIL